MIKSKIIRLPKPENFDNDYIEKELGKLYKNIVNENITPAEYRFKFYLLVRGII